MVLAQHGVSAEVAALVTRDIQRSQAPVENMLDMHARCVFTTVLRPLRRITKVLVSPLARTLQSKVCPPFGA